MRFVVFSVLLFISSFSFSQGIQILNIDKDEEDKVDDGNYPNHCSDEADGNCKPCYDTIRPLPFIKQVHDIGLLFPSWKPVGG